MLVLKLCSLSIGQTVCDYKGNVAHPDIHICMNTCRHNLHVTTCCIFVERINLAYHVTLLCFCVNL